jgi:Protein of unknown function (DUF3630)
VFVCYQGSLFKVCRSTMENFENSEKLELLISKDSDWKLFNGIADAILKKFKGKLVEVLDGVDERYWDIEVRGQVVTLHLEHYTGIYLISTGREQSDLIGEIGKYLEKTELKSISREMFYLRNFFRLRRRATIVGHATRD